LCSFDTCTILLPKEKSIMEDDLPTINKTRQDNTTQQNTIQS